MMLFNNKSKKLCECNIKTYKYVGYKISLEICYKCGKFDCKTDIKDDDFLKFIVDHPEIVPELVKMKYLVPA